MTRGPQPPVARPTAALTGGPRRLLARPPTAALTGGPRRLLPGPAVAALVALAVAAVVVTACGSGPPTISATASSQLSQQVQVVQAAAVAGNGGEVESQLARLRTQVATLEAQHQMTSGRAAQILSAASAVSTEMATVTTPAPAAPSTTAPPTSTTQNGGSQGGKGHGKKGK